MKCIFCDNENEANSVEHIVSESFGNKNYVMQKSAVCDACNSKFSGFEQTALGNSILVMERARFGVQTKKGRTAKGKVNELTFEGDKEFRENILTVQGLSKENFKDFNPKTQTGHLYVATFDKSDAATSKLLLKIGLESIYKSQRQIFNKYDFKNLKDYLLTNTNVEWPFTTSDFEIEKFKSVATYTDKHKLQQNHCKLNFLEVDNETLLFKFKYGAIPMTINLINRDLDWIKVILENDSNCGIFPKHYENKIAKQKEKKINKGSR